MKIRDFTVSAKQSGSSWKSGRKYHSTPQSKIWKICFQDLLRLDRNFFRKNTQTLLRRSSWIYGGERRSKQVNLTRSVMWIFTGSNQIYQETLKNTYLLYTYFTVEIETHARRIFIGHIKYKNNKLSTIMIVALRLVARNYLLMHCYIVCINF